MIAANSRHHSSNFQRALHRSIWLGIFTLAFYPAGGAQQFKLLPNAPGTWRLTNELSYVAGDNFFRLTEDEHRGLVDKMDTLVSVLHGTPVFESPQGFFAAAAAGYDIPGNFCYVRQDCSVIPPIAELTVYFYDILADAKGQPTWDAGLSCETQVRVNDLEDAVSVEGHIPGAQTPDGRWVWFMPEEKGRIAGFPTYTYESKSEGYGVEKAVLAANGRSIFVPITRQEFISALIYSRESAIMQDAVRAHLEDPSNVKTQAWQAEHMKSDERLLAFHAELEGMGADERASPAWYVKPGKPSDSGLVAGGTPGARQLVSTNPAYFQPELPRSAIQLISAHVSCQKTLKVVDWSRAEASTDPAVRAAYACFTGADWQRLAALIQ